MEALRAHGKLDNGQEQKYGLDDEGNIPIPPPTSLSTRLLWVFPVHQA